MRPLHRRRIRVRRLGRPARPAATPPQAPPRDTNGASTEFDVAVVGEEVPPSPRPSQQDSTVELAALPRNADPNAETAEGLAVLPDPPKKMEFTCPCGARLIATTETYDKHSRCAMCQTVMLLNVVYDPERGTHEIVPFRVNPD